MIEICDFMFIIESHFPVYIIHVFDVIVHVLS